MPIRPPIHNAGVARAEYERSRGNARQQGYNKRWDRLSRLYRRQHPLCRGCLALGRTVLTYCTDHIVPHKGDAARMWDTANLQPLCRWHHDVIKQQLELMHQRGEISDADLRIDSVIAIELSKRQSASTPGGA